MIDERFTVAALPHSVAGDADFHVSLFVSPRLTPDGDEGELQEFKHFLHWATVLADGDAGIELFDQSGTIAVTPILGLIEAETWDAVFPLDTPVRGPTAPDYRSRHWRTFRAGELHDTAKLLHVAAMFSDPTSPPAPSVHPLGRLMDQLGVGSTKRREYDESEITRVLDAAIGETGHPAEVSMSLEQIEAAVEQAETPLTRLAMQLHRARRFYERPEAELEYRERPLDGATAAPVPRPEPDFHERCSLAGDHPELQRRLGLVIDLVADDPDRLRESRWLSARIDPQGDDAACQLTRTLCRVVGDGLVTVTRTEDWSDERLRVGDTERFALLDMDPDGTALKLDRYLWTIPRLLAIEENGDPIHAAPTALRSIGFTVVRHRKALGTQEQLDRQHDHLNTAAGGDPPVLFTEDVTQGMRVEVWDDTIRAWFTLHARRIDAEALGHGTIVTDQPEEGFLQGTTATETPEVDNSPVHIHESVFGWEGWSLSATRPGKRVRHEAGEEIVEDQDADPDPVTPLIVTAEVEPGSLPRLRYGRSYAFRAWAANLAGNSPDHDIGPAPPLPASAVDAVSPSVSPPAPPGERLIPTIRPETTAGILRSRLAVAEEPAAAGAAELTMLPDAEVERAVLGRLRSRRGRAGMQPGTATDRAALVARAFADTAADDAQPFIVDTALDDATRIAHAALGPVGADPVVDLITPLRPFLRWDPVQPPAVVSRHEFSAGESLRQVVIRSGVTQDLDTLEITIEPPEVYGPAHSAFRYRPTSERHLVPPKTSQSEAELHGAFDRAIGAGNADRRTESVAVALREAGTLFDTHVPRLDDPSIRDLQDGIDLAADPTVPASTLKTLPLPPGEPPAPGQYIIHDTDDLVLPYLPDVLARGISLVFPEAGRDRLIAFPFSAEGFTARYQGLWPEQRPIRLVLGGANTLGGRLVGRRLEILLPPGDVQRFRLATALDRDELDLFGLWRSLPTAIRNNPDVAEAAADGWMWALTPFDDVTLVHAVPRPLEAPRPTKLLASRATQGATDAFLFGGVDVHGPSTEELTAEARWVDPVDDLSLPAPEEQPPPQQAIAFTTRINEAEDLAILYGGDDGVVTVPGAGPVWLHNAVHRIGDTKHHTIQYRLRATTRFREYFDAETLTAADGDGDPEAPVDDGQSVVGPEFTLSIPSSARPAAPVIHAVLPLFRWDIGTEPEQPVATRRRRRAGVRIYIERPWYSSGEGELLGVLLAPGGNDATATRHPVSQWGADPIWVSAPVARRGMYLELDNLLRAAGIDDRPGDALPVTSPETLPLASISGKPPVTVLGYRPQYNLDRGLWYVDVAIDPGSTFWPFVRLAVARYQPDSIADCHLSAPVQCDFVQLSPERTASVSRTDVRHVRVVVSGPIGVREAPPGHAPAITDLTPTIDRYADWVAMHRTMVARLQRRDPAIPTDLGWETVAVEELTVRGFGRNVFETAWVGELEAPQNLPLRTPGQNPDWRVTIEEWERLPGDPEDLANPDSATVWEQRLIYADEVAL